MYRRSKRPQGQPTRGKTAFNRLRQIDVYVALAYPSLLADGSPLIVDVGYGAYPWTTLEMRERLLTINPRVRVLGVEIDTARVAFAQPYVEASIDFRLGGFNLRDVLGDERVRLIRCYNVLRQYDESAVAPALAAMSRVLEPNGLLIEGTSTPSGRWVVFDVYRMRDELEHEALVFGTNFRAPVEAVDFQTILPKRLIHHMRDPILAAFFEAWQREFVIRRGLGRSPREVWREAAFALRDRYPVDRRAGVIRRGYLGLQATLS